MVDFFGVPGTGRVRDHIRSGADDAEDAKTVGDDLAGRIAQSQPRGMQVIRGFVALRQHAARVVEPVVIAGQVFEVAGNAVRFTQFRGGLQHAGEFADVADQHALLLVRQELEVLSACGQAQLGGVAGQCRESGVRVLHVVDRVFVGCRRPQRKVDVDGAVHRGPDERVPGGIDADRVDEVVERDHRARTLTHPHRLAVADQVDHLADQHLDGRGILAERGRNRLESGDVAVVVGAEHVDAQIESAFALVEVVGDVGGDVGGRCRRS